MSSHRKTQRGRSVADVTRRYFLGAVGLGSVIGFQELLALEAAPEVPKPAPVPKARPIIYRAGGPGRGNPPPHKLMGEDLVKARLTPETWRLEIVGDGGCKIEKPRKLDDDTAIDFATLLELGKKYGVKFLKAMQCRSGNSPQDHDLWEAVPLREVLKLAGGIDSFMRVYANGYHNDDPKQLFQSSADYTQVMDNAPGELPVMVAYRQNGGPIPLPSGGPVRLIMPWGYGFKNIKWLQRIRLTGDTKPIDTYGGEPDAYLKTQIPRIEGPESFKASVPTTYRGMAVVGLPGLKRVEYWLRPDAGTDRQLAADDPTWQKATWQPCAIDPPPDDWTSQLPKGISTQEIWGFDPKTGKPKDWPLCYSVATWTLTLKDLKPGDYELRVRTVDLNGFAQPQPRPQQGTGRNLVPCKVIKLTD